MKGCILGGIVLLLVIAAVIGNALFVRHTAEDLTARVDTLPDTPDASTPEEITALQKHLEAKESLLGISVSYAVIDKVTASLLDLEAAARMGDVILYQSIKELVKEQIGEIGRLERVSLKNIL